MARTTAAQVRDVLGDNYDHANAPSLQPFIDAATVVVDDVAECAAAAGYDYTAARLELIERWYAAHLYTRRDPTYKARTTAAASGAFNTTGKEFLEAAIALDPASCLAVQTAEEPTVQAGAAWLGKRPSEQTPYVDRS